jgi:hypothetical protein
MQQLRDEARRAAGDMCEWPHCHNRGQELAHIRGKGMGGSAAANTLSNVAWLCKQHHDVLDGRAGELQMETQLRFLNLAYTPGQPGTKFAVRTALETHVIRERAARRDGRLSQYPLLTGRQEREDGINPT